MNKIISNISRNWQSGLTVALVSIPLSVSLALASQTTPVAGIITAIWAGLIAAAFGGSHFNIVGPTGALSGVLATYAIANGAGSLPTLALVTGLFVLIAYALKLEKYLVFIPASTIHGFTLGVAFIIGLNQLNSALGLSNLPKHGEFVMNVWESITHIPHASLSAVTMFLLFLVALFALVKVLPRFPGAIILSPIGILLGYLATIGVVPISLETLGSKYGDIQLALISIPQLQFGKGLFLTAAVVALIAILETLISAKIADAMTKTKHERRKEVLALGFANIVTGMFGGIPATAALARTTANIKSGAKNRTSGIISALSIGVISLVLLRYFVFIPMPVIAAILVFVAYRMIEMDRFKALYNHDRKNFFIALVVAFVTVYEDPIIGILLGTAISLLLFMDTLSHGHFELIANRMGKGVVATVSDDMKLKDVPKKSDILVYSIKGQLAYINSQAHLIRLENLVEKYQTIVLRLRELYFIDMDGVEILEEVIEKIQREGKKVVLTGVNENIDQSLVMRCAPYSKMKKQGLVFGKTTEALRSLGVDEIDKKRVHEQS